MIFIVFFCFLLLCEHILKWKIHRIHKSHIYTLYTYNNGNESYVLAIRYYLIVESAINVHLLSRYANNGNPYGKFSDRFEQSGWLCIASQLVSNLLPDELFFKISLIPFSNEIKCKTYV